MASVGATCWGIAFEFPESSIGEVESYLIEREGKDFQLEALGIVVGEIGSVRALVPMYRGKNLVAIASESELLKLIREAAGSDGRCSTYLANVRDQLGKLGIRDGVVEALYDLVSSDK